MAAWATIAEAGIAASCIIGGVGRAAEDGIFPEEMTAMTQVELAELHLCQYYRREAIQTEIRNNLIAFASFNLWGKTKKAIEASLGKLIRNTLEPTSSTLVPCTISSRW